MAFVVKLVDRNRNKMRKGSFWPFIFPCVLHVGDVRAMLLDRNRKVKRWTLVAIQIVEDDDE